MKVCCVSDLHGNLVKIPPCDVLVIAGDITPATASPIDHKYLNHTKWFNGVFNQYLKKIPAKRILAIAGNHDFVLENPLYSNNIIVQWTYLQDSFVDIEDEESSRLVRFYGTPWTPWFRHWAFNSPQLYPEDFLKRKYELIPEGVDVLISHGPAYGIGDYCNSSHVGSHALDEWVISKEPQYLVSGHIHEGYGTRQRGKTTHINCSVVDEHYSLVNEPIVFEI